ncbi:MAG: CHASE2 domain-containing protein [Cyanophyceae cyanobacterium]
MQRSLEKKIKRQLEKWQIGIVVVGLVTIARLMGALQFLEWATLDCFLRQLPTERNDNGAVDDRIVIVGIDDRDIQQIGHYPLPDANVAELIAQLQTYEPAVIGFDIFRDIPVEPGYQERVTAFQNSQNLIAIEKVLPPDRIPPPSELSPQQVGFSDIFFDADGQVRRSPLGMYRDHTKKEYVFSLALRLAEAYLATQEIFLENGKSDPHAMRFNHTDLPRFRANTGGYVNAPVDGVQTLLNYRRGQTRFRTFSYRDIINNKAAPEWLRDRIVIVGITADSVKDTVNTVAIAQLNPPGVIRGVEYQAHATSQILSAVLEGRPLLKSLPDGIEYLWILGWGLLAIPIGRLTRSAIKNLLRVLCASCILVGIGYVLLWMGGWWLPVVPAWIVFVVNGVAYTTYYQNERSLKTLVLERQYAIDETFTAIHNGPLQSLAGILRQVRDQNSLPKPLLLELEDLNREIREIGDLLLKPPASGDRLQERLISRQLHLGNGQVVSLTLPLHELFRKVFDKTLKKTIFPNFEKIKARVVEFEPVESRHLSLKQKQKLCEFLEEALCNVGKHAEGATRLIVTGKASAGCYTLSIEDNGVGIDSDYEGQGTKQFRNLEKLLGGKFKRKRLEPKGTLCAFTWSLSRKTGRVNTLSNLQKLLRRSP